MTRAKAKWSVKTGPFFDGLANFTTSVTNTCLIALVTLVCCEALLRSAINYSLGFAEEFTAYLVVALTLNGAALAVHHQALFRVEFLFQRLNQKTQSLLTWVFGALALLVCSVLAWKTADLMMSSLSRGKFAATVLKTPLWIPQMLMPIGFVLIMVFVVERMLKAGSNTEANDTKSRLD
jgi:TRAP-type C4-dicarboxylate transport system permease small subunit